MNKQRRKILSAVAAAIPAMVAMPKTASAWTSIPGQDVGILPPTGVWATLAHVTDGTDPSTSVIAEPKFTPEIRKLAGTEVTLTGYLQSVAGGFGKRQDYLLSLNSFHCPYCYPSGRGTLALATIDGHALPSNKRVTIKGTLALQEKDSSDFYFQIKDARIV